MRLDGESRQGMELRVDLGVHLLDHRPHRGCATVHGGDHLALPLQPVRQGSCR